MPKIIMLLVFLQLALLICVPAVAQRKIIGVANVRVCDQLVGGLPLKVTVNLDGPARRSGTIPIESNNSCVAVPGELIVERDQLMVCVLLKTRPVADTTRVKISVGAYGTVRDVWVTLTPDPSLQPPPRLQQLILPANCTAGFPESLTINLDRPANLPLLVSVDAPASLKVPTSLRISPGERSSTLAFQVSPSRQAERVKVTASLGETVATAITTIIPTPEVAKIEMSRAQIEAGEAVSATVTLVRANPEWPSRLRLFGSAGLLHPDSLEIGKGQQAATFRVVSRPAMSRQSCELGASTPFGSKSVRLVLEPTQSLFAAEYLKFHIMATSTSGYFEVVEPGAPEKRWRLKRKTEPKLTKISAGTYQAQVKMSGHLDGDGADYPVVLHFTMSGSDQKWQVSDIRIFSVNGIERPGF